MSELPRVSFHIDGSEQTDGLSMDIDQAVEEFRKLLQHGADHYRVGYKGDYLIPLQVTMRPCDCPETLDGLDEYCPLHGDKA